MLVTRVAPMANRGHYALGFMSKNWPRHPRTKPSAAQLEFLDALWRIIGTSLEDHLQAAKVLEVPLSYIRDLFEGRRRPDPNIVCHQQWLEKLAQHYPEAFDVHGKAMIDFAPRKPQRLRRFSKPIGLPSPEPSEFAAALRAIIGKYENINRVAGLLGCNRNQLGHILHGRHRPTFATVRLGAVEQRNITR